MLLRTLARATLVGALLIFLGLTPTRSALKNELHVAQQAIAGNRPDQALAVLELILQREPDLQQAHALSVMAAISVGDADQAAAHISSLTDATLLPDLACLRAEIDLLRSQPEAALQKLGEPCTRETDLLNRISVEFENQGSIDRALSTLHLILAQGSEAERRIAILTSTQDPERAHALLLAVSSSEDVLVHELAFAIETSRISDSSSYGLAQVGQAMARAGLWQLAVEAFHNAVLLDPDYAEALAYLGLALDQTGRDGLEHLQAAVAAAPDLVLPHLFLGRHWRQEGDPASSVLALHKAVELEPDDPGVIAELAASYLAGGQIPEARYALLRAVELAPRDPFFWGLLADFAIEQEIEVESLGLQAARIGIQLSPEDPLMHDRMASSYFLLGNFTLADRFLNQALVLAPGNPLLQYHLGILRHAQGDLNRARAALEMAIALDREGSVAELAHRTLARIGP
jgi:Flp pilus assembly protein TadD